MRLAGAGGAFCGGVAAHPEGPPGAPAGAPDRRRTALKLEAADFAIPQFFFRLEDYLALVESLSALGVAKPVIPGIMPITSVRTVSRMCELSGTEVPRSVTDRLEPVADQPDEVRRIG